MFKMVRKKRQRVCCETKVSKKDEKNRKVVSKGQAKTLNGKCQTHAVVGMSMELSELKQQVEYYRNRRKKHIPTEKISTEITHQNEEYDARFDGGNDNILSTLEEEKVAYESKPLYTKRKLSNIYSETDKVKKVRSEEIDETDEKQPDTKCKPTLSNTIENSKENLSRSKMKNANKTHTQPENSNTARESEMCKLKKVKKMSNVNRNETLLKEGMTEYNDFKINAEHNKFVRQKELSNKKEKEKIFETNTKGSDIKKETVSSEIEKKTQQQYTPTKATQLEKNFQAIFSDKEKSSKIKDDTWTNLFDLKGETVKHDIPDINKQSDAQDKQSDMRRETEHRHTLEYEEEENSTQLKRNIATETGLQSMKQGTDRERHMSKMKTEKEITNMEIIEEKERTECNDIKRNDTRYKIGIKTMPDTKRSKIKFETKARTKRPDTHKKTRQSEQDTLTQENDIKTKTNRNEKEVNDTGTELFSQKYGEQLPQTDIKGTESMGEEERNRTPFFVGTSASSYTEGDNETHPKDVEESVIDDTFYFNNVFENCGIETENQQVNINNLSDDNTSENLFIFLVQPEEWRKIQPETIIYKNGRQVRKLKGKWTNVFAEKISDFVKGCVLSFDWQNIRSPNSRRVLTPYAMAKAHCKGQICSGCFKFKIQNEPQEEEPVLVECIISGSIYHDDCEVNRRHVSGKMRESIAEELKHSSASSVYYETLSKASTEQMSLGNYSSAPNPGVIRKIVSEQMRKENLHQNIIAEVQVLKENYENEGKPYVRDIGLDPFCIIMFSDDQIRFLKNSALKDSVDLFIDATGSVVQNIPDQKRPYLYSVVIKPDDLPGVSIADMISTQHTIPRIELFLSTIKRSIYLSGNKKINIRKIETDFSFPLLQACLHTFNNLTVKTYLLKCFQIVNCGRIPNDMYVHHLCCSHMLKDFSRILKRYKHVIKKDVRQLSLKSFAILQNATKFEDAKNSFKNMCIIFLSKYKSQVTEKALNNLISKSKSEEETDLEQEEQECLDYLDELKEEAVFDKTIKTASPFTKPFEEIRSEIKELVSKEPDVKVLNEFYCSEVIQSLLDRFLPTLPLWSGILLSKIETKNEDILTRDSSAVVESWFKFIKNDIGLKGKIRPYKFIIANRKAINGRLLERQFPGARKKSSASLPKRGIKETDADINTKEEIWKKKPSTRKYHTNPPTRKINKITKELEAFPKVMKWGGQVEATNLQNTCTIDNALTILHLHSQTNPNFKETIQEQSNEVFKTLSTVFHLMDQEEYAAAKIVWIQHTNVNVKPSINLYGDEADHLVHYFDTIWKSYTRSTCESEYCPNQTIVSREEHGVSIHTSIRCKTVQKLVDAWMENKSTCNAETDTEDVLMDDNDSSLNYKSKCVGIRTTVRYFTQTSPVLIIRIYEHALAKRVTLINMLSSKSVTIEGKKYTLAGVTMHRACHYCAIVLTKQHGNLWFDGLVGKLQQLPCLDDWNPYCLYYCLEKKVQNV